jgi:hypothetical protein
LSQCFTQRLGRMLELIGHVATPHLTIVVR